MLPRAMPATGLFLPDVLKAIGARPCVPKQLIASVRETLEIWGWAWLPWKPSALLSLNSFIKKIFLQIDVSLYSYCHSLESVGL